MQRKRVLKSARRLQVRCEKEVEKWGAVHSRSCVYFSSLMDLIRRWALIQQHVNYCRNGDLLLETNSNESNSNSNLFGQERLFTSADFNEELSAKHVQSMENLNLELRKDLREFEILVTNFKALREEASKLRDSLSYSISNSNPDTNSTSTLNTSTTSNVSTPSPNTNSGKSKRKKGKNIRRSLSNAPSQEEEEEDETESFGEFVVEEVCECVCALYRHYAFELLHKRDLIDSISYEESANQKDRLSKLESLYKWQVHVNDSLLEELVSFSLPQ